VIGSEQIAFPYLLLFSFSSTRSLAAVTAPPSVRRVGTFPGSILRQQVVSERGGDDRRCLRRSSGVLVVRSTREKKREVEIAGSSRHE